MSIFNDLKNKVNTAVNKAAQELGNKRADVVFAKTPDTYEEFLALPQEKQEKVIIKAHEKGASVRQLVRVTGVSKGIIEKWLRRNR